MDRRRSLRQTAEQIVILAKDLVGGFFEIGVSGVFHFAFGKFVRAQLVLQKIQDLLLFFERQFPDFVDDFNRTHAGKLTGFWGNSKPAHGHDDLGGFMIFGSQMRIWFKKSRDATVAYATCGGKCHKCA